MTALDLAAYTLELAQRRTGGLVQWGSRNRPAVKALQQRLSDLGFATEVDGQWGKDTEAQFRAFQHGTGLKVDGKLGPKSLNQLLKSKPKDGNAADPGIDAIKRVVTGAAPAAQGTTGLGRVRAAQRGGGTAAASRSTKARTPAARSTAAAKAPTGPHGGSIDPATGAETATSKTGPIGTTDPTKAHTPRAHPVAVAADAQGRPAQQPVNSEFERLHPREGGKFAKKGDSGEQVSNAQRALNQVDKAGLKQDGQFGNKTQKAVKAFQQGAGLKVDGIVGPQTSGALRRKLNALRAVHAPAVAPAPRRRQ